MARRAAASAMQRFAYGAGSKGTNNSSKQIPVTSSTGGTSGRAPQAVDGPPATIHVRASWSSRPNHPPVPVSSVSGAPPSWRAAYLGIRQLRSPGDTPVDSMGCERLMDPEATPQEQRFQILVSLMLSSQTKDEVTRAAMERLKAFGCTAAILSETPPAAIQELIYPAGFFRRKSEAIRLAAAHCLAEYDGDIPPDLPGLLRLKGVGPKMAHIVMHAAWNAGTGIGVDIHVHRIVNRLQWVVGTANKKKKQETSSPATAQASNHEATASSTSTSAITSTESFAAMDVTPLPTPVDSAGTPLWTEAEAAAVADWAVEEHIPTSNPEATRKQLEEWLPRELWGEINLLLVGFGQTVCLPRSPLCSQCPIQSVCATGNLFLHGKQPVASSPPRAAGKRRAASPQRRRTADMPAVDMRPVARARAIAAGITIPAEHGYASAIAADPGDAKPKPMKHHEPAPRTATANTPAPYTSQVTTNQSSPSSSSSGIAPAAEASKRERDNTEAESRTQAAKPDVGALEPESSRTKRDKLAEAHPISPT